MRKRTLGMLIAVTLVAGTLTAGVTGARAATSGAAPDVCTEKRVGGTITFGQYAMPPSVDPALRSVGGNGGTDILSGLYDTLLRMNTKTGAIEPYLAASYTHNDAFTQYTLKLRPNVKFGDGNAFDAAAVVAAQTRYLAPGNYLNGIAQYISSIVAVDASTVQYNLSAPWAELGVLLSQTFGMIADPAQAAKYGKDFGITPNTGAGVGPYDLVTFSPPTSVVLKAKTAYWMGPVCIQTINSTLASTPQQSLDSFNTGQYQIAYMRDPTLYKQYTTTKPRVGHYEPTLVSDVVNVEMNPQSKSAHLDDVRVRQALQYATDVNAINQRGYNGNISAHTNLVPAELGVVKPTKGPKYDPAEATKLLNQVKSETGWDGTIRLTCASQSADQGIATAAVYNAAGFKVQLDTTLPTAAFLQKVVTNRDFDLACGGPGAYNGDFWTFLYRVVSGSGSYSQFNPPEWNAAMGQLAAAPIGTPAYQVAVNKIQALQNELAPQVIVGSYPEATLMQNSVHGLGFTIYGIALWGKAYLATK
jgi:peptide/nickel transport system substrate-binding protein